MSPAAARPRCSSPAGPPSDSAAPARTAARRARRRRCSRRRSAWTRTRARPRWTAPPEHRRRQVLYASTLKYGGLQIVPEDLLQRLHDLALGRARAGAVQQRVHQVAIGMRRRLAQRCKRALHLGSLAARARGPQALKLLALKRRIHAQGRDRLLVVLHEEGDAPPAPLPRG